MLLKKPKPYLIYLFGFFLPAIIGILIHKACALKQIEEPKTLSAIMAYAKTLPELPASDDSNWEDPRFEQLYKKRGPGTLATLLYGLGLWKVPVFSAKYLGTLLRELTDANYRRGLIDGKKNFIHIKALTPKKIIIFGDMRSSFHSLLRDLAFLKQQGVFSDNMTIKERDTYMVFNGNFIDRAAYNIDSLILLCLLMKQNPDQVLYIAGNHERNGRWLDYGLKRELVARGRLFSTQSVPFLQEVLNFFASLPEAVYVSGKNDRVEALRISFNDIDSLSYDQHTLSPSFLTQKEQVQIHEYLPREKKEPPLDVRAAVKSEDWRRENRIKHGLGLLDQSHGATNWAVLSSPNFIHRAFLNFYDDAFATIAIDKDVKDATIALTHQDTREMNGFQQEPPLSIISARIANRIVSHNNIKVASSLSLVRGLPPIGRQIRTGINTRINEFNQTGDENKSNIRIYIENDDSLPTLARQNALSFLAVGARFFLLPLSVSTVFSFLDLAQKSQSAIFFPATGAAFLRSSQYSYLVHLRCTYDDEVKALIKTLWQDQGSTKFAFFYQDDAYGRGPFKTALENLKRLGIENILALPYTRGTISFKPQVEKFRLFAPDALGFFATAAATREFIRQIGVAELATPRLFGLSMVAETPLRKFLKRKGMQILFGSPVPNPNTSNLAIARIYRHAMDNINNVYNRFSFEAYIATSIFLKAVDSVGAATPSPKQVLKVIEGMKNYDFHGLPLNFNPKTRSLAKYVWIDTDENSEWPQYPVGSSELE